MAITDTKRILVVDDEPDIVETLRFLVESEGFECITAMDGEDALKKAKELNPDIMILDVMLPKINGYKVCRLLKFDNNYKHIPILMVTARSQEEDRVIGEETGADEYITKPFDINTIVEKIHFYLKRSLC